jgi:HK97 family phage prohead protease
MPLPKPKKDEEKDKFLSRCMGDKVMNEEYKDSDQRYAVCNSIWTDKDKKSDATGVPEAEQFPKEEKKSMGPTVSEVRFAGIGGQYGKQRRGMVKVEMRTVKRDDGGEHQQPMLVGYAALYHVAGDAGTEFQLYDDLVECIEPGCFDRAIREDDVVATFNHSDDMVLGRTRAGTCRLSVDSVGLRFEIDPPDTTFAADLVKSIRREDIDGCSFRFNVRKQRFEEMKLEDGSWMCWRYLQECGLEDISIVTRPAYAGTSVGVRSTSGVNPAVTAALEVMRRRAWQPQLDDVARRLQMAQLEI